MEKFQLLLEESKKKLSIADHMLIMTYPVVNDPKLLLVVLENIFLSLTNSIGAILHHERLFKRVPPFQDNFDSKFEVLKEIAEKHNLKYLDMIKDIKDIILQHKKSPMEFTKSDRLIICSDTYKIKQISYETLKKYLFNAKFFINQATTIVKKDESIFR